VHVTCYKKSLKAVLLAQLGEDTANTIFRSPNKSDSSTSIENHGYFSSMFEELMKFKKGKKFSRISDADRTEVLKMLAHLMKDLEAQHLLVHKDKEKLVALMEQEIQLPFLTSGSALVSFVLKLTGHL